MIAPPAIADTLQALKAPVETLCAGRAAGAAVLVLACGKRGLRTATPNARIMFTRTVAAAASIEVANELQRLEDVQNDLLAMQTGRPVPESRRRSTKASFSAEEARSSGSSTQSPSDPLQGVIDLR